MWKGVRTVWQVCRRLFSTYDRVNVMFFKNGMRDRIDGLAAVTGRNIQEAVRIGAARTDQAVELARAFAHLVAVISEFEPIKGDIGGRQSVFLRQLIFKWGAPNCVFCQKLSCRCKDRRKRAELTALADILITERQAWSIRDWQQFLRDKYLERNAKKGIDFVVGRLNNEVIELLNVWRDVGRNLTDTPDDVLTHYAEEAADVFAWLLGVANLLEIDLEAAIEARYPDGGCHSCYHSPCRCQYWTTRGISPGVLAASL